MELPEREFRLVSNTLHHTRYDDVDLRKQVIRKCDKAYPRPQLAG